MKLLVVGCGYLGRRASVAWLERGGEVYGVTRSAEGEAALRELGVSPVRADVLDVASLAGLPAVDRVLYAVGFDRNAGVSKRAVYVDGLRNVLMNLPTGVVRFVYIGSTSVYGGSDGAWVDETTPAKPITEAGRICLDAENVLADWSPPTAVSTVVLRCSGLYGPGRIIRRTLIQQGEPIPGDPDRTLSLIHIDDAARAAVSALTAANPGPLYLASDDRPVPRRDYYEAVAAHLNAPQPTFIPPAPGSPEAARDVVDRKISNQRMKTELHVELRYPDVTTGVPAALGKRD